MRERKLLRRTAAMMLVFCLMLMPQAAVWASPSGSGSAASALKEPVIEAQGAVVIDAATGEILYGKNANTKYYPASITKLMTALLVIENCSLDSTVTFSRTATTNLESGAVSLGLVEGDQLTVRQCLYALLLKSANEVGNGLAEYVSGSISAFADLMNQKAAALGCTNTHFANPHGLNDPNHYTTPYDMALIARAAFANETLRQIDTTLSYKLPATKKSAAVTVTMGHKMMYPNDSRYYEGIIGGKTGYTSLAGNTLVTGAERNGVRLVAVVMKANGTHYTDTKALLDYGFAKAAGNAKSAVSAGPGTQQPGTQTQQSGPSAQQPGQAEQSGPGTQQPGTQTQQSGPSAQQPGQTGQTGPSSGQEGGKVELIGPSAQTGTQTQQSGLGAQQPGQTQQSGPASAQTDGKAELTGPSAQTDTPQQSGPPASQAGQQDQASSSQQNSFQGTAPSQQPPATGWFQDETGWYYIKSDGSCAAGEWLLLEDADYWIDSNGYMATGWRLFTNGDWYYFRSSGVMARNYWVQDNGKWFYLGDNGYMLRNTTITGGYVLGADGAWTGN